MKKLLFAFLFLALASLTYLFLKSPDRFSNFRVREETAVESFDETFSANQASELIINNKPQYIDSLKKFGFENTHNAMILGALEEATKKPSKNLTRALLRAKVQGRRSDEGEKNLCQLIGGKLAHHHLKFFIDAAHEEKLTDFSCLKEDVPEFKNLRCKDKDCAEAHIDSKLNLLKEVKTVNTPYQKERSLVEKELTKIVEELRTFYGEQGLLKNQE